MRSHFFGADALWDGEPLSPAGGMPACMSTPGGCMAVKQSYDVQTDIPGALMEHYAEKDGKWLLQLDPPPEDVTGLKNALNQERNLRREGEKTLTDLKVKFEGIDPEEHHKLQERVKGLDDADVYDKQGIESLVARRTESMKADHERVTASLKRENEQLKGTAADYERRWRQDRIKTALLDAVTKNGVYEKAVDDAVQRGLGVFTDLDEKGNVIARNGDDTIYGKDGVNPLSPSEWITTLKASGQAPHLWPASSGGGAPASHGGNGAGVDWNSITNPAERMTRYREWQASQSR
jgi:hypothetical protein